MMPKQMVEPAVTRASMDMVSDIHDLIHVTVKEVYTKYYTEEAVDFFLQLHNRDNIAKDIAAGKVYAAVLDHAVAGTGTIDGNHIKRVFVLPRFQRRGTGARIMDFLEGEIIKSYGGVWLDASLPAGKFYHKRGYVTKGYEEHPLAHGKVLAYEIMCRNHFPMNPEEYTAPSRLVRRELECQGIDLDELREVFPKRLYLLADGLYDAVLAKNAGTRIYPVGGGVHVMGTDGSVGFVKGEMCSPGIATQAEDLIAAGARELIHVGFAGGYAGTCIGDVVITDGAFHNTAVAGLYGYGGEMVRSAKGLTDSLCEGMDAKGIAYRRGCHWTTDAGYVQPDWSARYYKDKGALCVEMEGAGLFSAAGFRSCHAAGIYIISDSGSGEDWNLGWGGKVLEASIDTVAEGVASNFK